MLGGNEQVEQNRIHAVSAALKLASQLVTADELEVACETLEEEWERAQQATAEPLCNRLLWWRREKRGDDNGGGRSGSDAQQQYQLVRHGVRINSLFCRLRYSLAVSASRIRCTIPTMMPTLMKKCNKNQAHRNKGAYLALPTPLDLRI